MHIYLRPLLGKRLPAFPAVQANSFRLFLQRNTITTEHTPQPLPFSRKKAKMTTTATTLKGQALDKVAFDSLMRRRMFYTPSFEVLSQSVLSTRLTS